MLSWYEIIIRLSLASLFGALIGIERERKDWAAGLRTHMLVCVGSCLLMMVSAYGFSDVLGTEHVALDPSRIAAQVVSGIGFIGAGAILFSKHGTIRGLTTAAGLWTIAAIGLATGGGMYFAAGITTIVSLIILWALQPLEQLFFRKFRQKTLRIVTNLNVNNTELLSNILDNDELKIQTFSLEKNDDQFVFLFTFEKIDLAKISNLVNALKKDPAVKDIFWNQ
ncbi:MAG: MgtC/SapB family protein [Bacteroidetes bacterium]|nr:MgtC/SapB family protein [Bacteroidota bacterium]MBP7399416.1 MgtC/SapB family protein [Chitinophagales bacterium]MBP9119438.1 MgtC/SapB family protein [Ignavibacterium sp.]MBK8487643.1 MgtC/SapB family protein [Bacteroidota bacterium]MBK8682615.1 MgtC/SapB family protein [Bacteroidota bacterium]